MKEKKRQRGLLQVHQLMLFGLADELVVVLIALLVIVRDPRGVRRLCASG
jgi:hypothetical protein